MPFVHPLILAARGMCSAGEPYENIDSILARALEAVSDIEDELRILRRVRVNEIRRLPGQLSIDDVLASH